MISIGAALGVLFALGVITTIAIPVVAIRIQRRDVREGRRLHAAIEAAGSCEELAVAARADESARPRRDAA